MMVRLADRDRSTARLSGLVLPRPSGPVALRQVGDIEKAKALQVLREGCQHRIVVSANTHGRHDLAAIVADMYQAIVQASLQQGYSARIKGQFQAQQEAQTMAPLARERMATTQR